jgi:UDP-N-acetylglucosamine/UDP-N-acetyl-alpha-D-glucosaminouronate 4-epimerase
LSAIVQTTDFLRGVTFRWLVTGSAGFIGSHLVKKLLELDQQVVSVDNFSTGHKRNLDAVATLVGSARQGNHQFIEGDISDLAFCRAACRNVDIVLHQAALASVPRSIIDPVTVHASNVTGFLNVLISARDAGVRRVVYASSSAVYGDRPGLPRIEHQLGNLLSPYAATKFVNELYAGVFSRCYGLDSIGLRYFNVFGARQDPEGPYAAVIPTWVRSLLLGQAVVVNGDGDNSRDFCYVNNVVEANLLAATTLDEAALNQAFNIAVGQQTSLTDLLSTLRFVLGKLGREVTYQDPVHAPCRAGDIQHSVADISKARSLLGYEPQYDLIRGLTDALPWFVEQFERRPVEIEA